MEPKRSLPELVGGNVTKAIDNQGLVPRKVAEVAGIPITTFNRHLAGHAPGFNASQLEAISGHLHVDPIIFFKVIL